MSKAEHLRRVFDHSFWFARRTLRWPVDWLAETEAIWTSPGKTYLDIRIINAADPAATAALIERLACALRLVASTEPRWLRRVQVHCPRIVVYPIASGGYWRVSRSIVLPPQFVLDHDRAELAAGVVHEAVHARIYAAGIIPSPELRYRIEQRCLEHQIAFAERIEGTQALVHHLSGLRGTKWW